MGSFKLMYLMRTAAWKPLINCSIDQRGVVKIFSCNKLLVTFLNIKDYFTYPRPFHLIQLLRKVFVLGKIHMDGLPQYCHTQRRYNW
ncbi:hypothetical protein INR49_005314 [Caranx melampygus]|nr:hypothetical protein INR49_005314 [Caranx melampygus]